MNANICLLLFLYYVFFLFLILEDNKDENYMLLCVFDTD